MTAPVNVSPTAVGAGGGYPQQPQPPQAYAPYPYAMSQGKEMYMQGGPTAAYRRQSRFDPMASEETDEEGYGELGQRHPLRRVQEEEREDGVSLPSIRNLFSVAGEKERASPVGGAPPGNAASTSGGPVSPVSSSPVMQDQRSRYSSMGGSTFSSVSDQFGWWQGPESERGRTESAMSAQANGPFRAHSFPGAAYEEDHDAKRRRSDQPASMRDPEEAARLRWQAQNRNASYPASGSMAGNGLRSLIHPPHGSYRGSVSVNDGTGYPPPPPTHDDSMRPPNVVRNGSVGSQLAHSFAELSAAEQSAIRNSASRSPSMAPPPAPSGDRRSSAFSSGPLMRSTPLNEAGRAGPPRQSAPGNLYDPSDPARRQSVTQPPSPSHQQAMRQASMNGIYAIDGVGPIDPNVANLGAVDMDKPSMSEPSWSRRTSAAETHATGIHLGSDSDGSTAKGSRGKKRGNDDKAEDVAADGDSGMGGMDVLAESAERAEAAAAGDEAAERDPSPPRNGTGPKYTCSYCQKTFSRPSSLRIHTYSHTGERPFVCQEPSCGRRFSVQSNLKRHAKVHALVNQQEADRLRAMYSHHNNQPRHPDGLPPMQHQHQHHMQHQQQMGGPMGGMPPPGPAPPPHIMNVRDPRMYGGPGMHTPGQPFSSVPPHAGGMPTHGQQPVMPYGYPGMPNMHPAPGMNPQGPPASAPPPQMPVDGQHGYSNYSFYDSQGGAGMSNYGQPPQQHPHTLPPPMSGPPHQQAPPPGYHMATGVDMADPYQYQKN